MKTFRFTGMFFLALVMSFSFTACGGDDDSGSSGGSSGTPSSETSAITTTDGETILLTSIKNLYNFEYDDQGRCTSISGYDDYKMSYDPFTLEYGDLDDDESYDLTVSFNKSGYISKMSVSEKWGDKEYGGEGSGTISFTYDGSGHLTKTSMSGSGKNYEDGYTESWTSSSSNTLAWSEGNLMSAEEVWKETSDGEVWNSTDTYTYEYGSIENYYYVYTYRIAQCVGEDFPAFALIGFLGKGTAYLPSAYNYSYVDEEDGEIDEYSSSYTLSYTLNDNGTIKTEKRNSSTYTYTYSTLSESSRAVADELSSEVSSNGVKTLVRTLLHGKRAKSKR